MANQNYILKMLISLILIFSYPFPVFALEYACTIRDVFILNDVGQYVNHIMENNYMNRKIFIDRETGKVIGTTALRLRFRNFDKTHFPKVLHSAGERSSYKVVTMYEDKGLYAAIRIVENIKNDEKPFSYQTVGDMLLTGTCIERTAKN